MTRITTAAARAPGIPTARPVREVADRVAGNLEPAGHVSILLRRATGRGVADHVAASGPQGWPDSAGRRPNKIRRSARCAVAGCTYCHATIGPAQGRRGFQQHESAQGMVEGVRRRWAGHAVAGQELSTISGTPA